MITPTVSRLLVNMADEKKQKADGDKKDEAKGKKNGGDKQQDLVRFLLVTVLLRYKRIFEF